MSSKVVLSLIGIVFLAMIALYFYLSGMMLAAVVAAVVMLIVGFFFATVGVIVLILKLIDEIRKAFWATAVHPQ